MGALCYACLVFFALSFFHVCAACGLTSEKLRGLELPAGHPGSCCACGVFRRSLGFPRTRRKKLQQLRTTGRPMVEIVICFVVFIFIVRPVCNDIKAAFALPVHLGSKSVKNLDWHAQLLIAQVPQQRMMRWLLEAAVQCFVMLCKFSPVSRDTVDSPKCCLLSTVRKQLRPFCQDRLPAPSSIIFSSHRHVAAKFKSEGGIQSLLLRLVVVTLTCLWVKQSKSNEL